MSGRLVTCSRTGSIVFLMRILSSKLNWRLSTATYVTAVKETFLFHFWIRSEHDRPVRPFGSDLSFWFIRGFDCRLGPTSVCMNNLIAFLSQYSTDSTPVRRNSVLSHIPTLMKNGFIQKWNRYCQTLRG